MYLEMDIDMSSGVLGIHRVSVDTYCCFVYLFSTFHAPTWTRVSPNNAASLTKCHFVLYFKINNR